MDFTGVDYKVAAAQRNYAAEAFLDGLEVE
jgi:hypothetical protein